ILPASKTSLVARWSMANSLVIGRTRGVRRSTRQFCLPSSGIDDIPAWPVPFENSPDVADVVHEARDDEVGIIVGSCGNEERAPFHDVVPGQRHEHRMLDILIEGIAVADALERKSRQGWDELAQTRVRGPEAAIHVRSEK